MEEACSESDVSLSPSQILERLQALRQLQLLQRGKLQKQRLQYQETSEASSSITKIVSHFSNSVSYNTFRSLLQSPQNNSCDVTPQLNTSSLSNNLKEQDLVEGVSVLNLSQESEFIVNSPSTTRSRLSPPFRTETAASPVNKTTESNSLPKKHQTEKHQISLDEMPILSPRKDFETLVLEKLQKENNKKPKCSKTDIISTQSKRPFLKRGEGMTRFGLNKKDLVIQNTKSLPWRQKSGDIFRNQNKTKVSSTKKQNKEEKNVAVEILVTEPKQVSNSSKMKDNEPPKICNQSLPVSSKTNVHKVSADLINFNNCEIPIKSIKKNEKNSHDKNPLNQNKGKTWAAVLTKEQNDFLRQLKQSDYYKNFASPAKSTVSVASCDHNLLSLQQDREVAEQNMFDLLESKVSHESFSLDNSFFHRFLRKSKLECSGESTPLIMQKCLASNPQLFHISPDLNHKTKTGNSQSDVETCDSEYSECCSDACSSVSSCCSCKTLEPADNTTHVTEKHQNIPPKETRRKSKNSNEEQHQNDIVTDTDIMKVNMADMNAKLIATSELLKDRLRELEDEIETFRKENANLSKLREEVDLERQKFYEEKSVFEQKFNEEKVLSEYYLSEEKEKLIKQKQMYDRYVREIRGRLNKKDKDEVSNLKKEINDLKGEIRIKDAKSTSTIARLRNQIKIIEKEKKDLQSEVEKLKKENRRIQHSNEVTRRLTNIKYLEEINKKLSHMATKETQSEINLDGNVKYKAFEIERQSRSRRALPSNKTNLRPRAKSVPNLNVTSRYAKYFSQRDAVSHVEKNQTLNVERLGTYTFPSDDEGTDCSEEAINVDTSGSLLEINMSDSDNENNLEKLYTKRFQDISSKSNRSSLDATKSDCHNAESDDYVKDMDPFFIRKSISSRDSKSPNSRTTSPHIEISGKSNTRSKSPISILNRKSSKKSSADINKDLCNSTEYSSVLSGSNNRSKSPLSKVCYYSTNGQIPATNVNKEQYREELMNVSPEPTISKTSLSKTSLNPTEIQKPDGSRELRFPNGNVKYMSADRQYSKFVYYNGDVKENFYNEGRIKYFYAETKTFHTTYADGLQVLEFSDGQVEKRYKDGSSEIRLPNGSVRYYDPKNEHVHEEWRFPDGAALTIAANGEQRIVFPNGQVEVHAEDHKRREFPDGTVKLVYNDGTSETRYASGRVRIKDKHGNLIMDSAPG